jgi:hypothetical protein
MDRFTKKFSKFTNVHNFNLFELVINRISIDYKTGKFNTIYKYLNNSLIRAFVEKHNDINYYNLPNIDDLFNDHMTLYNEEIKNYVEMNSYDIL